MRRPLLALSCLLALIDSLYLGGSPGIGPASAVAMDSGGHAYVTGAGSAGARGHRLRGGRDLLSRLPPDCAATMRLRAARAGGGDGRVYHLRFRAEDGRGGSCEGEAAVCVPHDRGRGAGCADGGPLHDSAAGARP